MQRPKKTIRKAPRKGPRKSPGKPRPAKMAAAPLFEAAGFLTSVGTGRSTTRYQANKSIFRQGDPADGVFYIQKGKVKLTVVSEQGKEGVIAILDVGDFFGEGCLAGQPLHMASAVAMADSMIVKVEIDTIAHIGAVRR